MKNQKLKISLLGFIVFSIIAFAAWISSSTSQVVNDDLSDNRPEVQAHEHSSDQDPINVEHSDVDLTTRQLPAPPALTGQDRESFIETSLARLDAQERASLLSYTQLFDQFISSEKGTEDLIIDLKDRKTSPFLMEDENPYTGSLKIIRTKDTLPGTRYFHAQIFRDDDGRDFIQHMSFEFRPGETSFDGAKAALMKSMGLLSAPTMQKDGFISWSKGPYTIWAKQMTLDDFKDNTFNAHENSDVGTIWVAMELEIHDHEAPINHLPASGEASLEE